VSANLGLVRSISTDRHTVIDFFAPDAVWVGIPGVGDATYQGMAIRDFWVEWYAPYEDVQIELVEVVYLGGDVVMAVIRQSGRLGDAPSRVGEEIALVYEWSDGLIERVTTYTDIDEARAAAERLAEERR
jgi:hypothetical protein